MGGAGIGIIRKLRVLRERMKRGRKGEGKRKEGGGKGRGEMKSDVEFKRGDGEGGESV